MHHPRRHLGLVLAVQAALFGVLASPTWAQDDEIETTTIQSAADAEESAANVQPVEEVIVTGSRLRRDTFSSVAPMQIITTEFSKEVGLVDAADILQGSTAATGQQIDLTFQGFVLDNGPAASTVDLRGLGPTETSFSLTVDVSHHRVWRVRPRPLT